MRPNEKQIESKIKKFCEHKDFAPKYLKNIIVDVCHIESTTGRTASCSVCFRGVSTKELKKGCRYGYRFGQFYKKRHKTKSDGVFSQQRYFSGNICMDCISRVEKSINFEFKKSYAP